jgi:hypothetical protein
MAWFQTVETERERRKERERERERERELIMSGKSGKTFFLALFSLVTVTKKTGSAFTVGAAARSVGSEKPPPIRGTEKIAIAKTENKCRDLGYSTRGGSASL